MAIYKENQLKTLVSTNRCEQKPPYDTLLWAARWPGEFGEIRRKVCEEFVFEVLLGLDFSCQPNTGLGATKQRRPEKAGTIVRASSEFDGRRWFCLWAVAVLVQFSVWNGRTPVPYKKILPFDVGHRRPILTNQVRGTYLRKPVHGRNWINNMDHEG